MFIKKDVTSETLSQLESTEKRINKLKGALASIPDDPIGPNCNKPFKCPFSDFCFKNSGVEKDSVLNFPNLPDKWNLFRAGKKSISDLSIDDLKTPTQ